MLNKNEFWSIANRFFSLFANTIILFLFAKYLNSQDVALWYLFFALFGVIGIVEGGFMQVMSRHITYITSKDDFHKNITIDEFITVNNKIFIKIVLLITFLGAGLGTMYLSTLEKFNLNIMDYFLWILFVLASMIALWSNLYASIAIGFQKVSNVQKNQILSMLLNLTIVLLMIFLFKEYTLKSMIFAYLSAQIFLFIINYSLSKNLFVKSKNINNLKTIQKIIFSDMKKMFLNMLSYKLLTSVFFIILSLNISVEVLASYGLTFQVYTYILSFSTILITANIPFFASLYSRSEYNLLKTIYIKKVFLVFILFIISSFMLINFFPLIDSYFQFTTSILNTNELKSFLFFISIELIITLVTTYLLISNKLIYIYYSLIATISIVSLTYVCLKYLNFSLTDILYLRGVISFNIILIPSLIIMIKLNKGIKIK